MNRYTFVIQIHPDGLSTLENLRTHERVRIAALDEVGPRIEDWMSLLDGAADDPRAISAEPEPRSGRRSDPA